eukprot:gene6588-7280_t
MLQESLDLEALRRQIELLTLEKKGLESKLSAAESKLSTVESSPTEHFSSFIRALEEAFGKIVLRPSTCPTVQDVLGLQYLPQLIGRDDEVNRVIESIDFSGVTGGRKPLNLVSGIPGVGKTRILIEAAQRVAPNSVLACTFNNNHFITNGEHPLFLKTPEVPVVLRLVHAYLFSSVSWASFLPTSLKIFKDIIDAGHITVGACLTDLASRFEASSHLLIVVDECLRCLDEGLDESCAQLLVRALCGACDVQGRSVVFSAMATSFLSEAETESTRRIVATQLLPLTGPESISLTTLSVPHLDQLAERTGLSQNEVIATLDALVVAGLPRAAEFLLQRLKARDWQRVPVPLSLVATGVIETLAQRYSLPRSLAHMCVQGVPTMPLNQPLLDVEGMTVRDAVLRGWLPQPAKRAQSACLAIPPALVLSALFKLPPEDSERHEGLRQAEINFAGLLALRPRDLWEEFVLRLIILRSHLNVANSVLGSKSSMIRYLDVGNNGGSEGGAAGASATDDPRSQSTLSGKMKLPSLFSLFPGAACSRHLTKTPVLVVAPLSNVVLQHAEKSPPSPQELAANPSLAAHLFVSNSPREPGMDALLFVLRADGNPKDPRAYLGVALQSKWSSGQASTALTLPVVKEARNNCFTTMTSRGWKQDNIILVFIAHRSVTTSAVVMDGTDKRMMFSPEVPNGVAVAGLNCGLEKWLGPSLITVAERIHELRMSHGPYRMYVGK